MMPKVTLLGTGGGSYALVIGVKRYVFRAGRPKLVPVAVAIEARKRKNEKGYLLFDVEDMPKIVEKQVDTLPKSATEQSNPEPTALDHDVSAQNAPALHLNERQRVFEKWPLEFM